MTSKRDERPAGRTVSRRAVLAGLGGTAALVTIRGIPNLRALIMPAAATPSGPAVRTVGVVRREDMLAAMLYFYDVGFTDSPLFGVELFGPSGDNPTVVVELPPQAIGEEVFPEKGFTPDHPAVRPRAVLAHPSRIAFPIESGEVFAVASLFSWDGRELRRTPTTNPSDIETSIEAPWAIELSPLPGDAGRSARFIARPPLTRGGITGLWTAELARTIDGDVIDLSNPPPVNVVDVDDTAEPFDLHTITGAQRENIKISTRDEAPVDVNQLVLSPLGAWTDVVGNWTGDHPETGGLTHWRNLSTMGRDHFVRVIEKGFLFPFGHRAVEVTISERKIASDNRAYLLQRKFIVVRQPVISYGEQPVAERFGGRAWPFRKVELLTLSTPDLLIKNRETLRYSGEAALKGDDPFWVQDAGGKDVRFSVRATDWDGNEVEFSLPMIFAKISDRTRVAFELRDVPLTFWPPAWTAIVDAYNALGTGTSAKAQRSVIQLGGQKVAIAPSETEGGAPQPDAAGYEASKLILKATTAFALTDDLPAEVLAATLFNAGMGGFRPEIGEVEMRIDQVETITQASAPKPTVALNPTYLLIGYAAQNAKGVFADLVKELPVPFPADKVGAILTPNTSITGLVRDLGPVGDVKALLNGPPKFDPKQYFPSDPTALLPVPKLLGGLKLPDLLASGGGAENAPTYRSVAIYPNNDRKKPPKAIDTTFDWTPIAKDFEITPETGFSARTGFFLREGSDPAKTIEVHGRFLMTFENGVAVTNLVNGVLRDFQISLGPLAIDFTKVSFVARDANKPEVDVQIADVKFQKPLTFVNELAKLMREGGAGGLAIDADAQGVAANYTLAIPDISIGVFAMKNMTMFAGIEIPFTGDNPTRVHFDFCTKDDPFLITVYCFSGTGYFGIEVTPDAVQTIRASLGFGAAISLDFKPVASGSARIHAGVNFTLESSPLELGNPDKVVQKMILGGYLSLAGSIQVTIVSVSISLYLTFEYIREAAEETIRAKGVLTIEVDLALVSKTITKTVEYTFAGGGDGASSPAFAASAFSASAVTEQPTYALADQFEEQDWFDYAGAFAPAT